VRSIGFDVAFELFFLNLTVILSQEP
jgi:hypothetical protein